MIKILLYIYKIFLILIIGLLMWDISNILHTISYCDGESINDFVIDRNDEGDVTFDNNSSIDENSAQSTVPLRFVDKIRRRISWYITAKNRGTYNSYDQYKEHWNPNTKIISQFKSVITEDFKKARLDAKKTGAINDKNNERLMSDIKASRNVDAKNRTRRYFEMMNNRKK